MHALSERNSFLSLSSVKVAWEKKIKQGLQLREGDSAGPRNALSPRLCLHQARTEDTEKTHSQKCRQSSSVEEGVRGERKGYWGGGEGPIR